MDIDVGSGVAVKVRDFVELVAKVTDSQSNIEFGAVPMRENELMYSCADTRRMKTLGWEPAYSLHDAVMNMINKETI